MCENIPLLVAERIFLRVNLDASALVLDVDEHAFAHLAMSGDASGERDFATFDVIGSRLSAFVFRRKFIGKRVDAFFAERGQFGFAPQSLPPVILTRDPGVSFMLPAILDGEDDGALECSI